MSEKCSCGEMDLYVETDRSLNIGSQAVYSEGLIVEVVMKNIIKCDLCKDVIKEKEKPVKNLVFEADYSFEGDCSFEEIIQELEK